MRSCIYKIEVVIIFLRYASISGGLYHNITMMIKGTSLASNPDSFTFLLAYFSCSSDNVIPVYLQPVFFTSRIAKVPQPQPMSRT
jgi:hypothetical protein